MNSNYSILAWLHLLLNLLDVTKGESRHMIFMSPKHIPALFFLLCKTMAIEPNIPVYSA